MLESHSEKIKTTSSSVNRRFYEKRTHYEKQSFTFPRYRPSDDLQHRLRTRSMGAASQAQAQFAKTPLYLQNESQIIEQPKIKHNIMFFIDNSGSMGWGQEVVPIKRGWK